jgi:hypothetical protein
MVQIAEHVEAAIVRALAKDPAERYATAAELADALAGHQTKPDTTGHAQAWSKPPAKKGCIAIFLVSAAAGITEHLSG